MQEKLPACARRVLERGRSQERGSTPERECTRNKEGETTRRRAEKWSEKVSIKVWKGLSTML